VSPSAGGPGALVQEGKHGAAAGNERRLARRVPPELDCARGDKRHVTCRLFAISACIICVVSDAEMPAPLWPTAMIHLTTPPLHPCRQSACSQPNHPPSPSLQAICLFPTKPPPLSIPAGNLSVPETATRARHRHHPRRVCARLCGVCARGRGHAQLQVRSPLLPGHAAAHRRLSNCVRCPRADARSTSSSDLPVRRARGWSPWRMITHYPARA